MIMIPGTSPTLSITSGKPSIPSPICTQLAFMRFGWA